MSLTANVVASAPILSAWGNEIRDRSVQVFATTAQRTSQWAAPPQGAVSVLTDTPGVLWVYTGSAWRPVNGLGVLAYVEKTATQTNFQGTAADVTGLTSGALTILAGRRTEVSAEAVLAKGAPDTQTTGTLQITDAANAVQIERVVDINAPGFEAIHVERTLALGAGTYTFKARALTGGGFMNIVGSATNPAWLRVRDLGPV